MLIQIISFFSENFYLYQQWHFVFHDTQYLKGNISITMCKKQKKKDLLYWYITILQIIFMFWDMK